MEALGLVPQRWEVTDTLKVAGYPALRMSYDSYGVRFAMVVVAATPSIWEQSATIIDSASLPDFDDMYVGLHCGTVLSMIKVTQAGIVPDWKSRP